MHHFHSILGKLQVSCRAFRPEASTALANGYNTGYTKGMKTAVSIPNSLFHAAEELAERLGIPRSQLYRRALEEFLKARGHDVIRETLDAVYAGESDGGGLDPAIEYLQDASIEEDGW